MPITQPITCNVTGSITISISGSVQFIPVASATTWDPENVYIGGGGEAVFSNGNFTVSSTQSGDAGVRSTTSRNSGVRVAKFLLSYTGDPGDEYANIGLADPEAPGSDYLYLLSTSGMGYDPLGEPLEIGAAIASGEHGFVFVDQPAGKGWFDNESDIYETDREAGTNPHFTFTPGTDFDLAGGLHADSGTTSITIVDPGTFTSGRFGAWDA